MARTDRDKERAYRRKWYLDHKETEIARARKQATKMRGIVGRRIKEIKDVPCADCGNRYPSYVMDFDHQGDKAFNIGKELGRGLTLTSLEKEASKCEVVCANCHRERTHQRGLRGEGSV